MRKAPTSSAPVSRDEVDTIIKRKAPSSLPPPGFKPKDLSKYTDILKNLKERDDEEKEEGKNSDDHESNDYNRNKNNDGNKNSNRRSSTDRQNKDSSERIKNSKHHHHNEEEKSSVRSSVRSSARDNIKNESKSNQRNNRNYDSDAEFEEYEERAKQRAREKAKNRKNKKDSDSEYDDDDDEDEDDEDEEEYNVNGDEDDDDDDDDEEDEEDKKHGKHKNIDEISTTTRSETTFSETKKKVRKEKIFNFIKFLKGAKNKKLKDFLLNAIEPGVTVRCYIERDRFGSHLLGPVYTLCADLEDGTGQDLLVAKKVLMSRSPHYVFSIMSDDLYKKRAQRSKLYLGKLRGLSSGQYTLFCQTDPSIINDNDHDNEEKNDESSDKKESVMISYTCANRPAPKGNKGLEVCFANPNKDENGVVPTVNLLSRLFDDIKHSKKPNETHQSKCIVLHERKTKYDPLSSCLVDYNQRANMASIKNFQLVKSPSGAYEEFAEKSEDFILQLGKTTEDCFNVDIRHPLSPFQAFAICISRFDMKLNWKE